ncbi:MAG: FtsW/RodA/SpoVE family cell cycle protein, partial [Inquilinus sp.]|nr:FtsW/RodA/SpoVE family cell cycle protein [Inquilinus sp.]
MRDDFFIASRSELTIGEKLLTLNWGLVLLVSAVASIGFAMLYSAASGSFDPWASRQMLRFGVGLGVLMVAALVHLRTWMSLAYPIYFISLGLLVAVELVGYIGKGAERWIDLGFINLQPSELMKIAMVLALARYFHGPALEEVWR